MDDNFMVRDKDKKLYLGDGVYVSFDGFSLILTTENRIETTNEIFLEPDTYSALQDFVKSLYDTYQQI